MMMFETSKHVLKTEKRCKCVVIVSFELTRLFINIYSYSDRFECQFSYIVRDFNNQFSISLTYLLLY